jgi:putative holliday junction resolvase
VTGGRRPWTAKGNGPPAQRDASEQRATPGQRDAPEQRDAPAERATPGQRDAPEPRATPAPPAVAAHAVTTHPAGHGDALPETGRLLGIDLGEVRIGLALSDPGQVVASPAETLHVPRDADDPAIAALADAAVRHDAAGLVVGYPRTLEGREGRAAGRARRFADALRQRTGLPVLLWDERFTTVEAERVLLEADLSRADRKDTIDRIAASVLLQAVLEAQRQLRQR